MADKSIQLEDPITGEKVYPITLTDNIYLPNGTPLMKYLNSIPFPLGTLIHSTSILKNAGLHMADGGELAIGGTYNEFCQYVINNTDKFPTTDLTTYQNELATYGQCGKYVITSSYVKLPTITKLIGGLANGQMTSIASMNEAGLPNITGTFTISDGFTASGAFKKESYEQSGKSSEGGSADLVCTFDASRSNSIYGKSNTVETEYIKYPYYIVVATVTKTDIQVNLDNIATDLNNKLDVGVFENMKAKLLWENASPTSNFSAQTITLASADYDYLMVETRSNTSDSFTVTHIVQKRGKNWLFYVTPGSSSGYYMMNQCRTMTYVNATQYTISGNEYGRTGGYVNNRQDLNIPYRIYGFKGVQNV